MNFLSRLNLLYLLGISCLCWLDGRLFGRVERFLVRGILISYIRFLKCQNASFPLVSRKPSVVEPAAPASSAALKVISEVQSTRTFL